MKIRYSTVAGSKKGKQRISKKLSAQYLHKPLNKHTYLRL